MINSEKLLKKIFNRFGYKINKTYEIPREFNHIKNQGLLKQCKYSLKSLLKKIPELDIIDDNDSIIVKADGISHRITNAEEMFILSEIYVDDIYKINFKEKTSVIDIGMNIGISSLAFAKNENVTQVYSFEPAQPTYKHAMANLDLNPNLKSKIKTYNFGLGARDCELKLDYDINNKGRLSIIEDINFGGNSQIEVTIKTASNILEPILKLQNKNQVLVKLDCEGAEGQIIENLRNKSLLDLINIYIIEWHGIKNKHIIEEALKNYNLTYQYISPETGIITAF